MLNDLFSTTKKINISDDKLSVLRLIRSENVGIRTFFSLIDFFGSAKLALERIQDFSVKGGKSKPIKVFGKNEAEKELEALSKIGANIVSYFDSDYSKLLSHISDPPPILSYIGNIELLNTKSIAIVGARNASINGRGFAEKISKELVEQNITVVSGLARGVDTSAHKVAINKTIAVLAGGIDYIYPPENEKLYKDISNYGLVVAELPVGSRPLGQHFPQRNRIISGLSLGVAVIEATLQSGSLITARFALEQNREIFAMPGFPLDPRCQGTNKLIKEGAYLLESIQDIIDNLSNDTIEHSDILNDKNDNHKFKHLSYSSDAVSDKMRLEVLDCISSTPVSLDKIINATNFPIQIISLILLEFELAGKIIRDSGNRFVLSMQGF
jgi:DNA processing protein